MLVHAGECFRADHLLEAQLEALLEDRKKPLSAEDVRVSQHV